MSLTLIVPMIRVRLSRIFECSSVSRCIQVANTIGLLPYLEDIASNDLGRQVSIRACSHGVASGVVGGAGVCVGHFHLSSSFPPYPNSQ